MAKALTLDETAMAEVPSVPRAAQVQASKTAQPKPPAEKREPLQVRWPAEDVKAAKLAAIKGDFPTVSDFMLACFHAYMKANP